MTGNSISSLWGAKSREKEKEKDADKDRYHELTSTREKPPASFRLPFHSRSVSDARSVTSLHLPEPSQESSRGRDRDRDRDRDPRDAFRKSRRLSMNDAQCLPLFNKPLASIPRSGSKSSFLDFGGLGRSSRAQSRAQSPVKEAAASSKGSSVVVGHGVGSSTTGFLRSAFSTRKWRDAYSDSDDGAVFDDEGFRRVDDTYHKPIISFRGGHSWKFLETDRDNLYLDLFWPVPTTKEEQEQKEEQSSPSYSRQKHDILPLEQMAPLCNFRKLRFLKLTGMSQSYQKYIWLTVCLNPALEDLELEMALEPCIRRTFHSSWPSIKGDWNYKPADRENGVYYGDNGQGTLHRRAGIGEYLDKLAMEKARYRAGEMGASLRYLPIVKLSLTGFVVDSDPFFIWFHPHRLRVIEFKNDCVDAGFLLPRWLDEQVLVGWPEEETGQQNIQRATAVKGTRDVRVVEVGNGTAKAMDKQRDELMSKVTMSRFVEQFEREHVDREKEKRREKEKEKEQEKERARKAAKRDEALEQLESRKGRKGGTKKKKRFSFSGSSGEEVRGLLGAEHKGTGTCPPGYI